MNICAEVVCVCCLSASVCMLARSLSVNWYSYWHSTRARRSEESSMVLWLLVTVPKLFNIYRIQAHHVLNIFYLSFHSSHVEILTEIETILSSVTTFLRSSNFNFNSSFSCKSKNVESSLIFHSRATVLRSTSFVRFVGWRSIAIYIHFPSFISLFFHRKMSALFSVFFICLTAVTIYFGDVSADSPTDADGELILAQVVCNRFASIVRFYAVNSHTMRFSATFCRYSVMAIVIQWTCIQRIHTEINHIGPKA